MEKSITTAEYRKLLELLRSTRKAAGITQVELADRIDESQSFVSKIERGEIRLDILQLRTIVRALDTSLPDFVVGLERTLKSKRKR